LSGPLAQRQLSLSVVGADYPNQRRSPARRFEIELCKPGEPVELIPEPKNPADSRAVAVFSCRGVQLGYLTAERCGWIGGMLGRGREVRSVFQCKAPWGAVIRVAFDGDVPELPPVKPTSPSDPQDFYPDEIWPDD
jgi:hypothetical protein